MTLSRMALLLLAAAAPAMQAVAQPVTAEQAMDTYRMILKPTAEIDCPQSSDPDAITVCGRRGESDRYRIPFVPEPGRRITGEPVTAASLTKPETCTNIGQSRGCGSIDLIAVALGVARVVGKAIVEEVLEPEE